MKNLKGLVWSVIIAGVIITALGLMTKQTLGNQAFFRDANLAETVRCAELGHIEQECAINWIVSKRYLGQQADAWVMVETEAK